MENISSKDREILRELAFKKLTFANSERNDEILKMFRAQARGERYTPSVRLLFSNFRGEVVGSRLRCEGKDAQNIEASLLSSMVGRELFDDDTPISDRFEVRLFSHCAPFGTYPKRVRSSTSNGYHIEPVTDDIEADIHLFDGGSFSANLQATKDYCDDVEDIFGDILPTKIIMGSLSGAMTNPLVHLIGMQNYYLAMYDSPDALHKIMDKACTLYLDYYDYLEKNSLLLPTNDFSPLSQESFSFTDELPTDAPITSTKQMWGFLEAQEATAVSPDAYGEFVYPYMDKLVRRFGLLSYGCCERVDNLWEDYLSKWDNLRKLSVSPFNDENLIGEYLRGTRVVYYSKPRAEHVTTKGPLDEELIKNYFKGVAKCASGCMLEVAQREVGTIFGDFERARRYVELAKQTIYKYWQP